MLRGRRTIPIQRQRDLLSDLSSLGNKFEPSGMLWQLLEAAAALIIIIIIIIIMGHD